MIKYNINKIFSQTAAGRYLLVVLVNLESSRWKIVTAREMAETSEREIQAAIARAQSISRETKEAAEAAVKTAREVTDALIRASRESAERTIKAVKEATEASAKVARESAGVSKSAVQDAISHAEAKTSEQEPTEEAESAGEESEASIEDTRAVIDSLKETVKKLDKVGKTGKGVPKETTGEMPRESKNKMEERLASLSKMYETKRSQQTKNASEDDSDEDSGD